MIDVVVKPRITVSSDVVKVVRRRLLYALTFILRYGNKGKPPSNMEELNEALDWAYHGGGEAGMRELKQRAAGSYLNPDWYDVEFIFHA